MTIWPRQCVATPRGSWAWALCPCKPQTWLCWRWSAAWRSWASLGCRLAHISTTGTSTPLNSILSMLWVHTYMIYEHFLVIVVASVPMLTLISFWSAWRSFGFRGQVLIHREILILQCVFRAGSWGAWLLHIRPPMGHADRWEDG